MKGMRITIMAAALIIAGMTVYAQQGAAPGQRDGLNEDESGFDNPQGRGGPNGMPSDKKREEVRKKIEAVRMWRLTEELKLDEKTSAKLASFLSALDEKRRDFMRERMEAMRDLRVILMAGKADEKKMRADLDKLEKNRREMEELQDKEISGVKGLLSVEQQARYVIFQQDFRREMRGMIAGARGGGPGMRSGPGNGRMGGGPGSGGGPMQGGPGQPTVP
jgi:Spy/CpxP family protein refolding chaperone